MARSTRAGCSRAAIVRARPRSTFARCSSARCCSLGSLRRRSSCAWTCLASSIKARLRPALVISEPIDDHEA
eukprot:scaffold3179_cov59-Phaeocystis_antarctica.AAC.11